MQLDIFQPLYNGESSSCSGIRLSPQEGIHEAFIVCTVTERYPWAISWLNKTEGNNCALNSTVSIRAQLEANNICASVLNQVGGDEEGITARISKSLDELQYHLLGRY